MSERLSDAEIEGAQRWAKETHRLFSDGFERTYDSSNGAEFETVFHALRQLRTDLAAAQREPAEARAAQSWLIWFEDSEMRPEIYSGHGAECAARNRYAMLLTNWDCHLFARVAGHDDPDAVQSAELSAAAIARAQEDRG